MVGAFPVIKLGTLLLKQISKPLANALKRRAKDNVFFRTYVCMPPAQLYHFYETRFKLRLLGLGPPKNVPKLSDESAVDLGAEMLGEMSSAKEAEKDAKIQHKLEELSSNILELLQTVEAHDIHIRGRTLKSPASK